MNHGKACNFFWPGLKNPMVSPFTVKDVRRDFWGYIIFETHTSLTWSLRPWNCCMSNMLSNQQHHHLRSKNLGATFPEGWCRGHPFFVFGPWLHLGIHEISSGKWLAMVKNLLFAIVQKSHHLESSHWESSKNESRDGFPLSRWYPGRLSGYLNHMFLQFLRWSYTPLASFEGGSHLMSCPSLVSLERSYRQQLNELLQLEKALEKKAQQVDVVRNKHLSGKKDMEELVRCFHVFFVRVVFPIYTWIFAQICQMSWCRFVNSSSYIL